MKNELRAVEECFEKAEMFLGKLPRIGVPEELRTDPMWIMLDQTHRVFCGQIRDALPWDSHASPFFRLETPVLARIAACCKSHPEDKGLETLQVALFA